MLVDARYLFETNDPFSRMIAEIQGNEFGIKEHRVGVYETGHFGSSPFAEDWEEWSDVDGLGAYGVCDSVDQILARCPSIEGDPNREFMIRVTPVLRSKQSPEGGWRWHKWGEYIGAHQPQHEYLYDEEGIDGVLCFHIYERKKTESRRAEAESGPMEPAQATAASEAL